MCKEKLSICIPTYNRSKYLKRAIDSCLIGKHNIKIYVQDNNSQDNTKSIVDSFNDERIIYEKNKENIGAVLNIEKLLKKIEGEYLIFLTDDDYFLPGGIEKILNFIQENNPDYFLMDTIVWLEKSKQAYNYSYSLKTGVIKRESYDEISNIFFGSHVATRCCLKKEKIDHTFREIVGRNLYPTMTYCMEMIINGASLGYIAEPIFMHIWENEIYWEKDAPINNRNEFTDEEVAKIILASRKYISEKLYNRLCLQYYEGGRNCSLLKKNVSLSLNQEIEEKYGNGEKYLNEKIDYVIFGTGVIGKKCYKWFGKKNKLIKGVIDNSVEKKGKEWNGNRVETPDFFVSKKVFIIIASTQYTYEMAAQLMNLGFEYSKDFLSFEEFKNRLMR